MAHVFTPGLTVSPRLTVRKSRRLPILGDVLVKPGDTVDANKIVARTELPGKVFPCNVANSLGCLPNEVPQLMLKKPGERVKAGEAIARSQGFLGYFRNEYLSPITGFVDDVSKVSGQVMLREEPIAVTVDAYINGEVESIIEREGVVVVSQASLIQGIFGIGGEVKGVIKAVATAPSQKINGTAILPEHKGKVLICGGLLTQDAVRRAASMGVSALVTGGFDYNDIKEILGYELGVAITGTETIGTTLVVTEGFGDIHMARQTFELLMSHEGKRASINGATQIRAGVLRPEVIVTLDATGGEKAKTIEATGIDVGSRIRAIRHPYFGRLGIVTALPNELQNMPSETKVRVLVARFDNGEEATLPRANVEAIQD